MSATTTIAQALKDGILVFDGAMGTEIYRHHVFTNRSFDELCLSDPKMIREIHTEYVNAGADVLETNTFGANRVDLGRFGLADKLRDINCAGARLAKEVAAQAGRPVFVAGSVGPLPPQPQFDDQWESMILEQVDGLVEGGADFILFETLPNRRGVERCAAAMRQRPETPFMLSFAVTHDCETTSGESLERMLAPLPGDGPAPVAWGLNCGLGPDGLLAAVERAVRLTPLPLVVQPNAGMPREVDNRRIYLCSPEYLTEYAKRYVSLGVAAVGGCCGTTPDHIREMAAAVKPLARASRTKPVLKPADTVVEKEPVPLAHRSHFARRLVERQWVTTVELLPPRGYDLSSTIAKSRTLREHGVNAVNIPDGPRATARISPLVAALRIQQDAQIEAILHFCCRDRNLIGMQADLLACAACGIHNILFVTGDPPKLGDYPHATGVFDTDSIGMSAVQNRLNRGIDLGGQAIDPPTRAVIGVGLDPTALDRRRELDRFRQKLDAGAEFAITQPVFDPDALLRFLDELGRCSIPILAGVWPLSSLRNAQFMQNEVPGVEIPDSIMQRMASVEGRDAQLAMGVRIAQESVARIHQRVAGIQVSAPFGKIETALAVIEGWES
jgi:methionine synthase I (cobalamin-dependent)/5,10-methylenetetrahydrofolate reductase